MDENTPTPNDEREAFEDAVFFDFMNAREAALQAAVGSFLVSNIPTAHLREIADNYQSEILCFAARIALYQRGEDWR